MRNSTRMNLHGRKRRWYARLRGKRTRKRMSTKGKDFVLMFEYEGQNADGLRSAVRLDDLALRFCETQPVVLYRYFVGVMFLRKLACVVER
jgi:hypothetical protein